MQCPFVVGQKVVSLWGEWTDFRTGLIKFPPGVPALGQVCQIIAIQPSSVMQNGLEIIVLFLKEFGTAKNFGSFGFRPLQERPKEDATDISVFAPLLKVTGPWSAPEPTAPTPAMTPELEPVP